MKSFVFGFFLFFLEKYFRILTDFLTGFYFLFFCVGFLCINFGAEFNIFYVPLFCIYFGFLGGFNFFFF